MTLLSILVVLSTRKAVASMGYEAFRKMHYVVAAIYMGACWAHWSHLKCWMIASLGIWGLDRGLRFLRTLLKHVGYLDNSKGFGFHPAHSTLEYFPDKDGGIIRLDFNHNHDTWSLGQHFYLTFPSLTIWQSHPFTVASVPSPHPSLPHHTYIIRCWGGETGRLKSLLPFNPQAQNENDKPTTPIILSGPYGRALLPHRERTNILAIAGGTGISLTLPLALAATSGSVFIGAAIDFIWIIRRKSNLSWISKELEELKQRAENGCHDIRIRVFVTQEDDDAPAPVADLSEKEKDNEAITTISASSGSVSSSGEKGCRSGTEKRNFGITYLPAQRPSLHDIIATFMETRANTECRTRVVASGPASMGSDLRSAVASMNDGAKVWRGDRKWDASLDWDDRMG